MSTLLDKKAKLAARVRRKKREQSAAKRRRDERAKARSEKSAARKKAKADAKKKRAIERKALEETRRAELAKGLAKKSIERKAKRAENQAKKAAESREDKGDRAADKAARKAGPKSEKFMGENFSELHRAMNDVWRLEAELEELCKAIVDTDESGGEGVTIPEMPAFYVVNSGTWLWHGRGLPAMVRTLAYAFRNADPESEEELPAILDDLMTGSIRGWIDQPSGEETMTPEGDPDDIDERRYSYFLRLADQTGVQRHFHEGELAIDKWAADVIAAASEGGTPGTAEFTLNPRIREIVETDLPAAREALREEWGKVKRWSEH